MQLVIAGFTLVCMGMIAYTVSYGFYDRYRMKKEDTLVHTYTQMISTEWIAVDKGDLVSKKHCETLKKTLRRLSHLIAFEKALSEKERKDATHSHALYYQALVPVFDRLTDTYIKKDAEEKAYFAFVVGKLRLCGPHSDQRMTHLMAELMKDSSLYCRRNAFRALCLSENIPHIRRGLKRLTGRSVYLNVKLLTEDLLEVTVQKEILAAELMLHFSSFSDSVKVAVLNFMNFSGTGDPYSILSYYQSEEDMEVRLSCLRYLGKYPTKEGRRVLMTIIKNYDDPHWEYVSTAAFGLSHYKDKEVAALLKNALHSRQWYVRYNAAYSLASMQAECGQLLDMSQEDDRFAKEILSYHLDLVNKKKVMS